VAILLVSAQSKRCTKCGEVRELVFFAKAAHGLYKKSARCKKCDAVFREKYQKDGSADRAKTKWRKSVVGRACIKAKWDRYKKTEEHRKCRARYRSSVKHKAASKRYKASKYGREACARYKFRRRARIKSVPCTLTALEWAAIIIGQEGKCAMCGRSDEPLTRDHIVPVSLGGHHTKENIQGLCAWCNSKKNNRMQQ